VEFIDYTVLTN